MARLKWAGVGRKKHGDIRETKMHTCQSFVFMLLLQRHHLALNKFFAELQDACT